MINSVAEMLEKAKKEFQNQIAFRYMDGEAVKTKTFAEYAADVNKFAVYLEKKGLETDAKVGLLAKNSYHYLVALMGTIASDRVVVPINAEETWDRINVQIELTELGYIFSDKSYEEKEPLFQQNYSGTVLDIDDYEQMGEVCEKSICADEDLNKTVMILFTSGTTGQSKGVMLSQKNMFTPLKRFFPVEQYEDGMKAFLMVPMYHIAALVMFLSWFSEGSVINICSSPKYIYRDLKQLESNYTFAVPAIVKMWYKDIKKGKIEKLGGIRGICCGGAALEADIVRTFAENGIIINKAYALTETCGKGSLNLNLCLEKAESVGKIDSECEYKIVDQEIWIKGPAITCGYYKNPEETANAFENGWFKTGDLGCIDEEGYLYITGRKKNLIILSGGENVSPEELEELILQSENVMEVLVKQVEDTICAEIYAQEKDWDDIKKYIVEVNKKLAYYKRVTKVQFSTEPLKKTVTGKLVRNS